MTYCNFYLFIVIYKPAGTAPPTHLIKGSAADCSKDAHVVRGRLSSSKLLVEENSMKCSVQEYINSTAEAEQFSVVKKKWSASKEP